MLSLMVSDFGFGFSTTPREDPLQLISKFGRRPQPRIDAAGDVTNRTRNMPVPLYRG
jgi:hypothetical protein